MLKNNLLSKFVLLCAVLLAGAGTAWADESSFEWDLSKKSYSSSSTTSVTWESDYATMVLAKGSSSTNANNYLGGTNAHTRMYKDQVLTITPAASCTISSVEITATSSTYAGYFAGTWTNAKATASSTIVTVKPTDGTAAFSFTIGSATRATKVVVTYATGSTPDPSTVAAPTFSPAAGAVAYGTTVTLTQDDAAMIMYTTNGTDPDYKNNVGTLYENPIAITADMTIKAIAIDADENVSAVASAEYTVQRPAAPTFSPVAGKVAEGTTVTISGTGAMIIYTTDGTTPTYEPVNGDEYKNPIEITSSMTIKAIVVDEHEFVSSVAEATYVVSDPNILFYETFDNINGTGGRDGSFSGSVGTNATTGTDETWTAITGGGASKCIKLGTGSAIQTAQTSAIALEGDGTLTFSAAGWSSGENTLVVQADNATLSGDVDITLTNGTWTEYTVNITGVTDDVVLYFKMKRGFLDDVKVVKAVAKSVATPTFNVESGEFFEAQNVTIACATDGAEIYYTLDGTTPTKSSTKYTGAISVSTTTTIKAIAYNGEDDSNVATVTLTFQTVYANIAAFIEANTTAGLNLTGAQVVYAGTDYYSNSCIYVKDATGTINLYGSELSFETGDVLSGVVLGTYTVYKTQNRVTNISNSTLVKSGNTTVVPEIISGDDIPDHVGELVTIKNTQITKSSSRYYICDGSIQMYDNFKVGYTPETGKDCDVTGIVITYETSGSIIYEIAPRYESDIVYLDNAVAVEIGAAGMATFSCDKALDFTGVDAIAAYTATVTTEGKITFTRIYEVPANTGLLLRNAQGEDKGAVAAINVPVLDGDAETVTDNALVAVDTEIAQLATETTGYVNYILNKVNGNLGFYKANNQKVAAGKAYLQVPATAARGSFAISFDNETTGIATVENASVLNENYYNLNGQRIVAPQKGLYIVNGKKVVLK